MSTTTGRAPRSSACRSPPVTEPGPAPDDLLQRWAKVLDQDKCIGCHACTTACKSENEVPLGVTRTYVKSVEVGTFPQVRRAFQVTRCNQCEDAPCVAACPTEAMYRRADGIVDFDKSTCIGCKACIAACPYDAIFINPDDNSAEKCNLCAHRLDVGLEPACVTVCPTGAILVGDLNDPESQVAQVVNREAVTVRRPEKGTRPGLFYKGAHQATLDPLAARRPDGGLYAWATQGGEHDADHVPGGHPGQPSSSAEALLSYDIGHHAPWGWRVSLYTWTKGLAAGALLVPLILILAGHLSWASPVAPLAWMRRYGAFEIASGQGALHEREVPEDELRDVAIGPAGQAYTAAAAPATANIVPMAAPGPDRQGRRPAGVLVDGIIRRGFPTPSGRLEFWSSTLADWGWPEHALPGYIKSHVHPSALADDQMVLLSTFRLPTQIHTRSGNSKWLDELSHTNPVWIHPSDAARLGIARTGDLIRVETDIGYLVAKAWLTEGIRPGVVACSHHMGRWKLTGHSQVSAGGMMATVDLYHGDDGWAMHATGRVRPYRSADPDTARIWWSDTGVHQNLTFPVHPDPISGMHCWHQAVRVRPAAPGDAQGDIAVDTGKARAIYEQWMTRTRPAGHVSPDGSRRPRWLMRPLKPSAAASALPGDGPGDGPAA